MPFVCHLCQLCCRFVQVAQVERSPLQVASGVGFFCSGSVRASGACSSDVTRSPIISPCKALSQIRCGYHSNVPGSGLLTRTATLTGTMRRRGGTLRNGSGEAALNYFIFPLGISGTRGIIFAVNQPVPCGATGHIRPEPVD